MTQPDFDYCAMPDAVPPRPRCHEQCTHCAVHEGKREPTGNRPICEVPAGPPEINPKEAAKWNAE